MLGAILHEVKVILAQAIVGEKTNEIPAAQQMIKGLENVAGSIMTFDAIHTQEVTARIVVMEKKADYVLVVKDNQKALKKTPKSGLQQCDNRSN